MSGQAARASKARKRRPFYFSYYVKTPPSDRWDLVECDMQPIFHPYRKRLRWPRTMEAIRLIEQNHLTGLAIDLWNIQVTRRT